MSAEVTGADDDDAARLDGPAVNPSPAVAMAVGPATLSEPVLPGRPYGGLSLIDRVAARRARFIDAGIALFGTQGLRASTVRGVCQAAGLTDRYFYESFGSLESLLQHCYRRVMDDQFARMERALAPWLEQPLSVPSIEGQLVAGYGCWFDTVSDPRQARLVLDEVLGVSPATDAMYQTCMDDYAQRIVWPLAGAPSGLDADRLRAVGHALVGSVVQVAKLWISEGYRRPRDEVLATCVQVAMGTFAALGVVPSPRARREASGAG